MGYNASPVKTKVLVAMSGGVDSSVAAALLLREGYEVVGCFMRLGSPGETLDELEPTTPVEACDPTKGPRSATRGAARSTTPPTPGWSPPKLDIPFYVCNFKKDFGRIIDYFVGEYNAGGRRTRASAATTG